MGTERVWVWGSPCPVPGIRSINPAGPCVLGQRERGRGDKHPRDALGTQRGDGRRGEPRAKAFTHGGGRGNGSFTGGGLHALEQPVHEETRVVATAALAAGIGVRTRAQDPVTAHALRGPRRGLRGGQRWGSQGIPRGPGPVCTHQAAPTDTEVRGAGAAAGAVQHPAEAVVEVVPHGQAVEVTDVGGCQSQAGREGGDTGDSHGPRQPGDATCHPGTHLRGRAPSCTGLMCPGRVCCHRGSTAWHGTAPSQGDSPVGAARWSPLGPGDEAPWYWGQGQPCMLTWSWQSRYCRGSPVHGPSSVDLWPQHQRGRAGHDPPAALRPPQGLSPFRGHQQANEPPSCGWAGSDASPRGA